MACSQIVACSDAHSVALVGGNDVVTRVGSIGDVGTEILQQRVGHAREQVDTTLYKGLVSAIYFYHKSQSSNLKTQTSTHFVPGISSSICLMGMHRGLASSER